jgi:hypothetical protein
MTKPLIKIHNVTTDEVIEREMTDEEFTAYEAEQTAKAEHDAQEATKAAARQAVLDKLGLTADEIAALLS